MRILILGGLGYIGSALIEQYKKFNYDDLSLDIIDKRFVPHIVAGLPGNFHFTHGNMSDDNIIDPLLAKIPDVIYLLAAEVEAEKSINKERAIWENNFEAAIKVIEKCSNRSRLIFASTGNVFGGVNENEKFMNLNEQDMPRPKYPYAESKYAVEKHLLNTNNNFTICRFGTNYGYAPGIRFNLVINNFIKKALSGEMLTVHGQGENYRPTVCVKDVVRAMLFLSEKKEAEGEIFHVVSENFKIKDLARKISSIINPSVNIENIAKEVPFSSYHLSSEKIQKFGFKFEWHLEKAVSEMKGLFNSLRKS